MALLSISSPAWAQAEPGPPLAPARTPEDLWVPTEQQATGTRLEGPPGFSIGLGAYGGLALLLTRNADRPHALAGLLSRARYGYAEMGVAIELTDRAPEEWRSLGGFVGAWLPYRNWVDFELAAGFAFRRYLNSDPRYGVGGYEGSSPALTLRFGLSDRSSEGLLGARIGAEVLAAFDLRRRDAEWAYQVGTDADAEIVRGSTPLSGFSIGIALSTGFDVALKRRTDATALGNESRAARR